jgi:L-threonylcarbamoyladenylate synthase
MPAHRVAFELILQAGVPVAAPSANLFGHTSPTTAGHVLDDLDGRIDAILDAGPTRHGLESTVLDPCQSPMIIYRPGAITAEQIRAAGAEAEIFRPVDPPAGSPPQALPSPGVGIRHYAPRARLILFDVPLTELPLRLAEAIATRAYDRIGLMLPVELAADSIQAAAVFPWGRWSSPEELAHNLYAGLHSLDRAGCTVILCPLPPEGGVGTAIRDRLRKAAG